MVYAFGIIGFVLGFVLGQMLLLVWLKDRSQHDLLHNRDLRWRYGLFNWAIAAISCYVFILFYRLVLE